MTRDLTSWGLEREAEIRELAADRTRPLTVLDRSSVVGLLAEIDRLRALPVLRMCGECGWRRVGTSYDGPVSYCGHDGMRRHLHDGGDCDFEPPAWCPLRGSR